jgi:hypothetical protein
MTTPPDTDVRAARAAAAQSAGRAGRWPLARLLLRIAVKLLLLSAVTSSMPACIIPVAPDFQDPDGIGNSPPEILNETPKAGSMVSATVSMLVTFEIVVADVNQDDLNIRWIVDGRPAFSMQPSVPGGSGSTTVSQTIHCYDVDPSVSLHPVRAFVADRAFVEGSSDPMAVKSPGKSAHDDWWLTLECPVPGASQP